MNLFNPNTISKIEDAADAQGKGSVWRACLAISRSCQNKTLSDLIMELAHGYCTGQNNLNHLQKICDNYIDKTSGPEHQAFIALKNALEDAPKTKTSGIDTRKDLWIRLDRLIK